MQVVVGHGATQRLAAGGEDKGHAAVGQRGSGGAEDRLELRQSQFKQGQRLADLGFRKIGLEREVAADIPAEAFGVADEVARECARHALAHGGDLQCDEPRSASLHLDPCGEGFGCGDRAAIGRSQPHLRGCVKRRDG